METTKQVKNFYESILLDRIKGLVSKIESEGFTQDTYTLIRFLEGDLSKLNAAEHFFNAHHPEGRQAQERRGA